MYQPGKYPGSFPLVNPGALNALTQKPMNTFARMTIDFVSNESLTQIALDFLSYELFCPKCG